MYKVTLASFDGNPGDPIPTSLGYPTYGDETYGATGYGTIGSDVSDDTSNHYTSSGHSGTGAECVGPSPSPGYGAGFDFYHEVYTWTDEEFESHSLPLTPILGAGYRFKPPAATHPVPDDDNYGIAWAGWDQAEIRVVFNSYIPDNPQPLIEVQVFDFGNDVYDYLPFDIDPNQWFEVQVLANGNWFVKASDVVIASGVMPDVDATDMFLQPYALGPGAVLLVDDLYVLVETPPTPTTPNPTISRRIGRRLISKAQVRVGGVWLSTVGAWGDLVPVWGRNGCQDATWSMALGRQERPSCLVKGAPVEIYSGPLLVWSGTLDAPDWNAGTFAAIGSAREGEGAKCLTSGGVVTSKPNTAINAAITRGVVPWTRVGDFGTDDLSGVEGDSSNDDPDIDGLNGLLNVWATENDSQWYVYPDRRLDIRPEDETNPKWFILPGTVVLGVAADDVTDRVFLRYRSSVDDYIRTVSYPADTPVGGIERTASITKRGRMSAARALTIATAMYRRLQAGRTGWTNGIDAHHGQVIDKGGLVANLALIRGGDTVRVLDHPDPRGAARYVDIVIGEVTWYPDENRVQLNPVGLAARTFESVMKQSRALAIDGPEYSFETTY